MKRMIKSGWIAAVIMAGVAFWLNKGWRARYDAMNDEWRRFFRKGNTNRDWIMSQFPGMTDEDFAAFFCKGNDCETCMIDDCNGMDGLKEWLRKEHD